MAVLLALLSKKFSALLANHIPDSDSGATRYTQREDRAI
jgi:hypothetical protein